VIHARDKTGTAYSGQAEARFLGGRNPARRRLGVPQGATQDNHQRTKMRGGRSAALALKHQSRDARLGGP
jgi:hypothetical protein